MITDKKFIVENLSRLRQPTSLNFRKYNIANQDRTMDGSLVVDYIASKDAIDVKWDYLSDEEFKELLTVINAKRKNNGFYKIEYLEPDSQSLIVVKAYTEEISYYPHYLADGNLIWRDISMSFVEV